MIVKCAGCTKKDSIYKMHFIPGKILFDKLSGMSYNNGRNYCNTCYDQILSINESIDPIKNIETTINQEITNKKPDRHLKEKVGNLVFKEGFVFRVVHAKSKNNKPYKTIQFKGENRNFYVWNHKLFDLIVAGNNIRISHDNGIFPHVLWAKKI